MLKLLKVRRHKMSNEKQREDPQPGRGNGPGEGKGRPVDRGHKLPDHGSAAYVPTTNDN